MKKNNVFVNVENETLVVSKAFYKRACVFGTSEYYELRQARSENEGFTVGFKTSDKKTYHGLSFEKMAEYIKTQPNSEEHLMEFEVVKRIAEIKGSKYPLTKKWFLLTYPEYKENEVSKTEQATTLDEMKTKAQAKAEKKMAEIIGIADKEIAS